MLKKQLPQPGEEAESPTEKLSMPILEVSKVLRTEYTSIPSIGKYG